jgi:hypothetical protein
MKLKPPWKRHVKIPKKRRRARPISRPHGGTETKYRR